MYVMYVFMCVCMYMYVCIYVCIYVLWDTACNFNVLLNLNYLITGASTLCMYVGTCFTCMSYIYSITILAYYCVYLYMYVCMHVYLICKDVQ